MNDGLAIGQQEAFAEIVKLLTPFRKGGAEITLDTDIARDLNVDSLAVMDMIMELEDKFDISIPLNVVAETKTVRELVDAVGRLRTGA
ncbi:MAG: acyl carrier protein [Reyranellaceae bacterium]